MSLHSSLIYNAQLWLPFYFPFTPSWGVEAEASRSAPGQGGQAEDGDNALRSHSLSLHLHQNLQHSPSVQCRKDSIYVISPPLAGSPHPRLP